MISAGEKKRYDGLGQANQVPSAAARLTRRPSAGASEAISHFREYR